MLTINVLLATASVVVGAVVRVTRAFVVDRALIGARIAVWTEVVVVIVTAVSDGCDAEVDPALVVSCVAVDAPILFLVARRCIMTDAVTNVVVSLEVTAEVCGVEEVVGASDFGCARLFVVDDTFSCVCPLLLCRVVMGKEVSTLGVVSSPGARLVV